jgi:cobalt-zinc-cadmium efflux system protein
MTHDHHGHSHGHHNDHHHADPNLSGANKRGALDRAFAIVAVLNGGFVVTEAIFGVTANSLALLADAAHNLGDVC